MAEPETTRNAVKPSTLQIEKLTPQLVANTQEGRLKIGNNPAEKAVRT